MSPEVIHQHQFSSASDVYAFGMVMWQCLSYGEQPWQGISNEQVNYSIETMTLPGEMQLSLSSDDHRSEYS